MSSASEILNKLSEPLELKDVDFRVQSVSTKGYVTILAYKDARVDQRKLDAVCGLDWQKDYKLIDGNLFCGIGIKTDGEWIWRWDVGVESYTEKTKGQASDAFKRAGFCFGIGRELYDYPQIFFQLYANEFKVSADGKKATVTWDFKLKKWTWEMENKDGKISLKGYDDKKRLRYDSAKDFNSVPDENSNTSAPPKTEPKENTATKQKLADNTYQKALKSTKVDVLKTALTKYDLTADQIKGISGRIAELNKK